MSKFPCSTHSRRLSSGTSFRKRMILLQRKTLSFFSFIDFQVSQDHLSWASRSSITSSKWTTKVSPIVTWSMIRMFCNNSRILICFFSPSILWNLGHGTDPIGDQLFPTGDHKADKVLKGDFKSIQCVQGEKFWKWECESWSCSRSYLINTWNWSVWKSSSVKLAYTGPFGRFNPARTIPR